MDHLAAALLLSHRPIDFEAFSARPNAPVVPYVEPIPKARRTRVAVAALLHRLGDVVAPRPVPVARSLG